MSVAEGPERVEPPHGVDQVEESETFRPIGTVTFLALYALVLVVLWLAMYLLMLSRGSTS